MNAKLYELNAGGINAPIIYEKDSKLPIVSFRVVFEGAGYVNDGKKAGLANLVCKLLNDGTKKTNSTKFAEKLEADAIELRASCGFETAAIEISCLREKWQNALTAMIELCSEPNFTQKALDKAKISIQGAIAKKQNDFDYVADSALKAKIFAGTPLAESAIGTKDSINAITINDIKAFFSANFCKDSAIVVAGGDIDTDEVQHAANAVLANLEKGKDAKIEFYKTTPFNKEIIIKKPTEQAYIYFGAPLNVKIDGGELYKAKVASFILGASGFGSRLMEEVRVKHGLAYSAYSRYSINKSYSYFTGYMQTKLENEQKAKEVTLEVINDYVKNGANAKELEGAQKFLLGSEPLRNETLSQRISSAYYGYYSNLGLDYAKKELELIKTLSLDELNAFIKAHSEIANVGFAVVSK